MAVEGIFKESVCNSVLTFIIFLEMEMERS